METDPRHQAAFESAERTGRTTAKVSGDTAVDLSVDLSSERPQVAAEALRPGRSLGSGRWLGAAMAGTAVVLLAIVGIVRASDDASSPPVARLQPQLRAPLEQVLIALEPIRMESMTAEFIRKTDATPARVSRRDRVAKPSTTPSSATPRVESRRPKGDAAKPSVAPSPGFRALPAPPPVEPAPDAESSAAAQPTPSEPSSDEPPTPIDDAPAMPPSPS